MTVEEEHDDRGRRPHIRTTRRRFLKSAGGLAAGLAAVVGFGWWLRDNVTPTGEVASGETAQSSDEFFAAFPERSVEDIPSVPREEWTIEVGGLVEAPQTIDWARWQALPRREQTVDFHCVEGWSVDDVEWGGVPLLAVLDVVRPRPEATAVRFYAAGDTYDDDITLEQAADPSVFLADTSEGVPLPVEHGGPIRLVVPEQLGYKSVKWVVRIEVTDERAKGYWEQRGYPVEAPIPEAQRQATEG
jgi:sulfoxide reductase catalytic subunit YedY